MRTLMMKKRSSRCGSMWARRSLLLDIRVRIRSENTRFGLRLPVALYALPQLLVACDGLLSILPGRMGERARAAVDTLHAVFLGMMASPPQEYVNVLIEDKQEYVRCGVHTRGFRHMQARGYVKKRRFAVPFGMPFLGRAAACALGMAMLALLFPGQFPIGAALLASLTLTLFYVFLRPIMAAIALPFNLLLFGLATPFTDALFVMWACAWTAPLACTYMQGVLASLLIGICYTPFAYWKRRGIVG